MAAIKEPALGVVDGVNKTFKTQTAHYRPGSLVAFRNGQAVPTQTVELTGRDFELEDPPKTGDDIAVFYNSI